VHSPAAKLNVLHATFARTNEILKEFSGGKAALSSMDVVFPVFMSIIVRSRIPFIGAQIQFLDDFIDRDAISGESTILLTTLKAAYIQLIKEYEPAADEPSL
jgi:amyotrophic lateral sclerosis 2 protein